MNSAVNSASSTSQLLKLKSDKENDKSNSRPPRISRTMSRDDRAGMF